MIVCLCNNLRTKCVRDAIADGARSPATVHRACGVKVNCGRCLPHIADEISAAHPLAPAE